MFDFYGAAGVGPAADRGCLLCNTAIEFGPDDPIGTRAVPRYLDRISSAFEFALDDAVRHEEIRASVDTTQEAQFLTTSVLGIFVMLRAGAPPGVVSAAATAAKRHVASLTPSSWTTPSADGEVTQPRGDSVGRYFGRCRRGR